MTHAMTSDEIVEALTTVGRFPEAAVRACLAAPETVTWTPWRDAPTCCERNALCRSTSSSRPFGTGTPTPRRTCARASAIRCRCSPAALTRVSTHQEWRSGWPITLNCWTRRSRGWFWRPRPGVSSTTRTPGATPPRRTSPTAGGPASGPPPVETAVNQHRHVGRNNPCPCGSGKKFKKCCLRRTSRRGVPPGLAARSLVFYNRPHPRRHRPEEPRP